MKTVGITGSIGSGKSTVAKVIESLNYPVFDADSSGKKHLKNPEIIQKISHEFGKEILLSDGSLNKKTISNIVFNDSTKLHFLNSIIHPLVIEDFFNWKENQKTDLVFMESALIFEHNLEYLFDTIICVWTPENECIERCIARDGVNEKDVRQRISNQMSPNEKCLKSDFVIFNENSVAILPQILKIIKEIVSN